MYSNGGEIYRKEGKKVKNIYFILLATLIVVYIVSSIRSNKLSIKTSFGWIVGAFAMIFLAIWPKSLDWLSEIIGIEYPPALFLTLCVIILFIINFITSKKLHEDREKIIELAQRLTLIENSQKENEEK